MIAIFKQKNPANVFLLLVFGVLIKLPMFTKPYVPQPRNEDGILFRAILDFLEPTGRDFPGIYPTLAFTLIFVQAILLTRFINNQRMISRPTYFPGMAYMLITSLFPEWNYFTPPLLVNTIPIWAVVAVVGVVGAIRVHLKAANYAAYTLVMTPLVTVLTGLGEPVSAMLLRERLVDTVLGCLIALVVGYLIWGRVRWTE